MSRVLPRASTVIEGPFFKRDDQYLSSDGDNPEAPWPGYGWPLGTECWWFRMTSDGLRSHATGSTVKRAWHRAQELTAL